MEQLVGAVDIGGSKVAIGIVGSGGKVYVRRDFASAALCNAGRVGLDQVVATLVDLECGFGRRLAGVGVGCTGPADPFTGMIGRVDTVRGWSGLNLMEASGARFGFPLAVENDADASALAEHRRRAGRGSSRFLNVTIRRR